MAKTKKARKSRIPAESDQREILVSEAFPTSANDSKAWHDLDVDSHAEIAVRENGKDVFRMEVSHQEYVSTHHVQPDGEWTENSHSPGVDGEMYKAVRFEACKELCAACPWVSRTQAELAYFEASREAMSHHICRQDNMLRDSDGIVNTDAKERKIIAVKFRILSSSLDDTNKKTRWQVEFRMANADPGKQVAKLDFRGNREQGVQACLYYSEQSSGNPSWSLQECYDMEEEDCFEAADLISGELEDQFKCKTELGKLQNVLESLWWDLC